jgi:hypothetical protein
MTETQEQLEKRLDGNLGKLVVSLYDSPHSLMYHIAQNLGFYFGVCYALGWVPNVDLIAKWYSLKPVS